MIPNSYMKLLHRASEANRNNGTETNRNCVVKEVKEEGGERKVRCVMGIRPDGSEWLSPWMSTQEQRSGQERSQSAIKPGQNGVIQGSFRQGTFSAQGESTEHAPQPTHAPETNGYSSSIGKKLRVAHHGGQDDQQQQGSQGGSGGAGGGGSSGGGGQQQKGEKEHYSASWIAKEEEKLQKWDSKAGKMTSTTGNSGGGGQQAASPQQGQQKQQKKEERAMQQVMHEKGGAYAVIGKGDDGVRYAAHEKGAKVRAGKENYFVAEKDKASYVRAKKEIYVHSETKKNYVNEAWLIKDSPKDPVPNHDLGEDSA